MKPQPPYRPPAELSRGEQIAVVVAILVLAVLTGVALALILPAD